MLHARHLLDQVSSVITITGFGDHDQPDWLITMTGIRITQDPPRRRIRTGLSVVATD